MQALPKARIGFGILKLQCALLVGRDHRDTSMDFTENLSLHLCIDTVVQLGQSPCNFCQDTMEQVEDHKQLVATAQRAVTEAEARKADAAAKIATAKDRIERIKRGEDVDGGLGKPLAQKDVFRILREAGWTMSTLRHMKLFNVAADFVGLETVLVEMLKID
jgi:hypothetical protein